MNKFINLRNGRITITTYRHVECEGTTLDDLINCTIEGSADYLTASFDTDELRKHPKASDFLKQYGLQEIWENLDIA